MKTLKFMATAVLCAAIAFGVALGVLAITGSGRVFALTYIVVALLSALAMGLLDGDKAQSQDMKRRDRRSYGQAA